MFCEVVLLLVVVWGCYFALLAFFCLGLVGFVCFTYGLAFVYVGVCGFWVWFVLWRFL